MCNGKQFAHGQCLLHDGHSPQQEKEQINAPKVVLCRLFPHMSNHRALTSLYGKGKGNAIEYKKPKFCRE